MKKILLFSAIAVMALTFNACKKDKYQPKGDYLTAGTNVNTVKTYEFTINTVDWVNQGSGNYSYAYTGLTAGTNMKGAINVYVNNSNYWVALPGTFGTLTLGFDYTDNGLLEIWQGGGFTVSQKIRCVIIPPARKNEHPEVNYANYSEVKKAFNLAD